MSLFLSTASPVHTHAHKTSSLFTEEGDENAHHTHNTLNSHVFPRLQGASKALFTASPCEGLSFSFDESPLVSHTHRQTHTHTLNESRRSNDESEEEEEVGEDLLDSSAAALLDGFDDEPTHTLSLSDCEASPSHTHTHTPSPSLSLTHTHTEAEVESESARKRRVAAEEERESERLAWQLMQEEEEALYNMQLQFMQTQVQQGALSDEDFRALQGLLQEPAVPVVTNENNDTAVRRRRERDEDEGDEEYDEEEQQEEEEEWDYDRLLALGQALGDVKTERWRMRAQQVIEALPVCCYKDVVKVGDEDADYRCVVCMENFEEDEQLRLLPCKHFFHTACTAGWLADHNSCPSCKRKVTSSP